MLIFFVTIRTKNTICDRIMLYKWRNNNIKKGAVYYGKIKNYK